MKIQPTKDRKYRPTLMQWQSLLVNTQFFFEPVVIAYTLVELINFNTSCIHLKTGKCIPFDGLNEDQYIYVLNGGYYEETPMIKDKDRI